MQTIGRLAPSPTGYLHLGNAWSFLIAWLASRLENGKILLRIEDIDPARSKSAYVDALLEDLAWLGIDYDDEIIFQSKRTNFYEQFAHQLNKLTYLCFCTRKELRDMAGAPQVQHPNEARFIMPDMGAVYTRTCRFLSEADKATKQNMRSCLRLSCPPFTAEEIAKLSPHEQKLSQHFQFMDLVLGKQNFDLNACGGDFALQRSDSVWAYQLAVSVDDYLMGITQVVRGEDILTSTPRQLYLFKLLNHTAPQYAHIPLLLDKNGDRLAKRHESLSLRALRQSHHKPNEILSFLASFFGIKKDVSSASDLLQCMQEQRLITFPWEKLKQYPHGIITKF